jgi:hypothetical protein
MHSSIKQCAFAGYASIVVAGCATQQGAAPEYRASSSTAPLIAGASMLQRGRAQLDAGLDALAIESFRAEIRVTPESADAYNGLAVAYGRIGRNDLAQRYFETALAKDPSNVRAQANLAKLTGDTMPYIQLAKTMPLPIAEIEPVSVTAAIQQNPIGAILDSLETPVSVPAEMPVPPSANSQPAEILARNGILSSRLAIAPARLASNVSVRLPPANPSAPPRTPSPFLPIATLPSDYKPKNGTRLERVSLGEVRLITRTLAPSQQASHKPEFESFGDRLAVWLPQSVAIEQADSHHGMIESTIIMAAIERAAESQRLAANDVVGPDKLPEFAYLFFHNDDNVASV